MVTWCACVYIVVSLYCHLVRVCQYRVRKPTHLCLCVCVRACTHSRALQSFLGLVVCFGFDCFFFFVRFVVVIVAVATGWQLCAVLRLRNACVSRIVIFLWQSFLVCLFVCRIGRRSFSFLINNIYYWRETNLLKSACSDRVFVYELLKL